LVILSLLSGKVAIYFLPALPALAIIMGRAMMHLYGLRAALFRQLIALFMFFSGLATLMIILVLYDIVPMPNIPGLPAWHIAVDPFFFIVPAIFFLGAFLIWLGLGSSRPEGVLIMSALTFTALSYPLAVMVAPALDNVLSPKAQAMVMRELIKDGYTPVSYKDYGGTYTYYAGRNIVETKDLNTVASMAEQGKVALAIRAKDWEQWAEKPSCFVPVHRQWIETRLQLLLACPLPPGMKPLDLNPVPATPVAPTDQTAPDAPASQEAAPPE
jgi:hypothetical protein